MTIAAFVSQSKHSGSPAALHGEHGFGCASCKQYNIVDKAHHRHKNVQASGNSQMWKANVDQLADLVPCYVHNRGT